MAIALRDKMGLAKQFTNLPSFAKKDASLTGKLAGFTPLGRACN